MSASTDADHRPEIHHRVPAHAERLPELRRALTTWTTSIGMPANQREELVLAVYEAMANAVEHAYRDHEGDLDLRATRDPTGTITVTVTDYGHWKPPTGDDGIRGRGLPLMNALAHRAELTRRPGGTTVTLTWNRPEPPPP